MEYLSTSEIAKKWGVSRKTVNRYATEGKIPGAYMVGNTWMIPANASKASCPAKDTGSDQNEFHFPVYLYCNFFDLKETLIKPEEKLLYSAFEIALQGNFSAAYDKAREASAMTADIPFRIGCLYLMCRCSIYTKQYSTFMKHILEMNLLFTEDFEYKEEMRTLQIDIETYYKGFDSLLKFTFDASSDFHEDFFPIVTTLSLYKQIIISFKEKCVIDTAMYEMALKVFQSKNYIYPSILLGSELAFVYYNKKKFDLAFLYAKNAYELADKYNGYIMLIDLYSISPGIIEKALKHYKIEMNPKLKEMNKSFKHAYIGLMLHLKKPKSLFNFSTDDYDYIYYAINKYTNKEIACEKHISENSVSQRYRKICRSFNVDNKKDLVPAFIKSLEKY